MNKLISKSPLFKNLLIVSPVITTWKIHKTLQKLIITKSKIKTKTTQLR
jgi:hypothetical protein